MKKINVSNIVDIREYLEGCCLKANESFVLICSYNRRIFCKYKINISSFLVYHGLYEFKNKNDEIVFYYWKSKRLL